MAQVEIAEAGADLRGLVERARAGEEITLAEAGCAVARLVPADPSRRHPVQLGRLAGQFKIPDDFDAPLPDDVVDLFYNGPIFPDDPPIPSSPDPASKP